MNNANLAFPALVFMLILIIGIDVHVGFTVPYIATTLTTQVYLGMLHTIPNWSVPPFRQIVQVIRPNPDPRVEHKKTMDPG